MHNGVFKTAEQVIEFYNTGAGHKFTKDMRPGMEGLPFFTILPNKLQLTETEKKELVSFFNSLTDTTTAGKVPKRLPKMVGKYADLNSRKIGGEY
jgi:cytochrome c peroxidase